MRHGMLLVLHAPTRSAALRRGPFTEERGLAAPRQIEMLPDPLFSSGREVPRPSPSEARARITRLEQLRFELEFFERVLKRRAQLPVVMRAHAANLAKLGLHQQAAVWDRRLVRLRPSDPIAWYNLACSLAQMGEIDGAFDALERAIAFRYPLPRHVLRDPDLRALRRDPRFGRIRARLMEEPH